ncbi:MAG: P27 family phage terminase small subunit [Clostridiales bacterium]|nr:P27 family phage terminase small subunit [Clostridiales bacterium]
MANGHGGARTGSGRKKTALSDKIVSGNPGRAPLTKLQFDLQDNKLAGEDMPRVSEYITQVTKNSQQNLAPQIYENTWQWLNERGCAQLVKKELLEQYALYVTRWIQCEEGINQYGLLAKHPTTQMPIASPYVSMGLNFLKQANVLWLQIYQIVKENCETPIGDSNPNDDIMERLLGRKA